ncbi:hypothetical protein CQW23_00347 [Capsicum baccatum]|uniref:Uncharacterized protein n=1 Tax=Capsicum baccatum TaxID=33114 RepID=A0A2G2XKF8_CAPBA|nr:hypothetical protein CQW23_00347 [Capsicum baccatum]
MAEQLYGIKRIDSCTDLLDDARLSDQRFSLKKINNDERCPDSVDNPLRKAISFGDGLHFPKVHVRVQIVKSSKDYSSDIYILKKKEVNYQPMKCTAFTYAPGNDTRSLEMPWIISLQVKLPEGEMLLDLVRQVECCQSQCCEMLKVGKGGGVEEGERRIEEKAKPGVGEEEERKGEDGEGNENAEENGKRKRKRENGKRKRKRELKRMRTQKKDYEDWLKIEKADAEEKKKNTRKLEGIESVEDDEEEGRKGRKILILRLCNS